MTHRQPLSRLLCLLCALLLGLPCAAWAEDAAPEITFRDRASVAFRDPYSGELFNRGAGYVAQCGQHTYSATTFLRQNMAREYIAQAEAALTALMAHGAADRPLTIHLLAKPCPPRVEGDTLYMSVQAFRSQDYIVALAQLLYGVEVNYGLLYAVACQTAEGLGVAVEAVPPMEEALPAFSGSGVLYADMNYACFIAPYASAEMQKYVRALARDFAATLTPEETDAFLNDYSDEPFYSRVNAYLVAHHLPVRRNQALWGMTICSGGPEVLLRWEDDFARYAVDKNFSDLYGPDWYGTADPLVSDYYDLTWWLVEITDVLSYTQTRLAPYTLLRKPLIIFETETTGVISPITATCQDGYYIRASHTIHAGAMEVIDHEYVHALLSDTSANSSMHEVVSYHFAIADASPNWSYDIYDFSYMYLSYSDPASQSYDTRWNAIAAQAASILGREADLFEPEDVLLLIDLSTLHRGFADAAYLTDVYSSSYDMQGAKVSYWRWLVRTLGESAAMQAVVTDDPVAHLGLTWDESAQQWIAWLQETYGPAR